MRAILYTSEQDTSSTLSFSRTGQGFEITVYINLSSRRQESVQVCTILCLMNPSCAKSSVGRDPDTGSCFVSQLDTTVEHLVASAELEQEEVSGTKRVSTTCI